MWPDLWIGRNATYVKELRLLRTRGSGAESMFRNIEEGTLKPITSIDVDIPGRGLRIILNFNILASAR